MLEFSVVLFGCSRVGKTALVSAYAHGTFSETYEPTIEDIYTKETRVDGEHSVLRIIDTEGAEQFHDMREVYIRGADAFLLVYDATDAAGLPVLEELGAQIRRLKGKKAVVCVLGTKKDLVGARGDATRTGARLAARLGAPHVVLSAKNPAAVQDAYDGLARALGANRAAMGHKKDSLSTSSASIESWLYSPSERRRDTKHQQPVLKRSALRLRKSVSKINKSKSMRNLRSALSSASLRLMGGNKGAPAGPDYIPNTQEVNEVLDQNLTHVTQTNLDQQPQIIDVVGKRKHGCVLM